MKNLIQILCTSLLIIGCNKGQKVYHNGEYIGNRYIRGFVYEFDFEIPDGILEWDSKEFTFVKSYKNKQEHGIQKTFHNGKLLSKTTKVNGVKHGDRNSFHPNGKLYKSSKYFNNNPIDTTYLWDETGKLLSHGIHTNGLDEVKWINYYKNGNVQSRVNLVNGLISGEYKSYYPNKLLMGISRFSHGLPVDSFFHYNSFGILNQVVVSRDSLLLSSICYDEKNKEKKCSSNSIGEKAFKSFVYKINRSILHQCTIENLNPNWIKIEFNYDIEKVQNNIL